jgi:GTP-binding protein HflX
LGTRQDEQAGFSTERPRERAIVVGVNLPDAWLGGKGGACDLPELAQLADTAGAEVVGRLEQTRPKPEPATFLGSGKLAELKEMVVGREATLVVFDNDLSPAQGRNLEKQLEVNVLDRTELILDIFAKHASTRQSRLQVELAQLQYLLPRLTRLWSHLERQAGGIGTRGPGETQLETDRRLLGRRIAHLRTELKEIESNRRTQTASRDEIFKAALIGYTNAGKSTLMNAITQADVYVKDQLFATLDATTRRVDIDERRRFLLTDTVGFIRKLPHHLVESFKATLQEVREADLLVHVIDASSEDPEQQIAAVDKVLRDLAPKGVKAEDSEPLRKPMLMVFNKIDLVDGELLANRFSRMYPGALFVSGIDPAGGLAVRDAILERRLGGEMIRTVRLPLSKLGALSSFHRTQSVLEQVFDGDYCLATLRVSAIELNRLLSREGAELIKDQ